MTKNNRDDSYRVIPQSHDPDDFFDLGDGKFEDTILPEIPADSSVSESELHRVEWENMAKHCGTTVQGIAIFSYIFFSGHSIGENFDLGIFGSYCFCGCALLANVVASESVYHFVEPQIYAFLTCRGKRGTIKVLCFCGPEISVLLLLDVFFIGLQGYIYAAWFTWWAGSSSSLWTGWFGWFTGCLLGYRARYCEEPLLHVIMACFSGFSTSVSDKNQIHRDLSCIGRAVTLCPTPGLLPQPCQSRRKPTCRLDMISVDPYDDEVPDRLLKISDPFGGFRTLEPGRFCLKSIKLGGKSLQIMKKERLELKSEKKAHFSELFHLGKVGDQEDDDEYLAWGKGEPAIDKSSVPSMSLTLGYASFDKHWSAFISHWAVHMVRSSLFCLFLILPVISVAAELRSIHDKICMPTAGSSSIPSVSHTAVDLGVPWLGSKDLCNDEESCEDLCMDLLHFAGAILKARDISWAELAVPLPLVFVTMLIAALQLALISHDADLNSYIQNSPVDKSQTALLKNYYSMINTSCEAGTLLRQLRQIYDKTQLTSGEIDDEVVVDKKRGSKNLILVRSMANVGIPPPLCEGTWIQDVEEDLDWADIKGWWNSHAKGSLDLAQDTNVTVTMDIIFHRSEDDQGSEDDHSQESLSPQTVCCFAPTVQRDCRPLPMKDSKAGPAEGTAELEHAIDLAQREVRKGKEVLPYFKESSLKRENQNGQGNHDVWLLPMYFDEPDPVKEQVWGKCIVEGDVEKLPDEDSGFTVFRVSAGKDAVQAKEVSKLFSQSAEFFATALNLTKQSYDSSNVIPKGSYYVYFQVAREDPSASPFFSVVAIMGQRGLVVIFALAVVLLAPFLRYFHGGDWFPQPFATTLKVSTLLQFLALWTFFDYFVVSNTKLDMITKALQNLETNTLAPSKKQKPKKASVTRPTNNPFDLYVATSDLYYHPACSDWPDYQTDFQKKTSHVKDWHDAVGYLRTFMSGARLSSQVVLVAAAFILATVVLGSIAQAMNGQGAFAVDAEELIKLASKKAKEAAAAGTSAIADGANAATKAVGDGAALGFQQAQNLMSGAVTPGRRLLLGAASASLDAVLQPAQLALHHAELQVLSLDQSRRLSTYTEALDSIDSIDIGKITKMQVLTIAIIIVIAWYSVPLIYCIAETNAFLDRHEQLLVAQQEAHQAKQKERQEKFNEVEECIRENNFEDIKDAMDPNKPPQKADDSFEDREKKNYEKTLHTAIAAAKKNRQKFSLSLFGFVINFGLLATWIFLALGPVFDQVKDLAPQLAYKACHSITEKIGDATEGIQDGYNAAAAHINRDIAGAGGVDKVLPLMNLEGFIDKSVCVPLKKWVKKQAKKSIDALEKEVKDDTDAQKALSHRRLPEFIEANSRRLQGLSVDNLEIEKAVEEWWHLTDLPRPAKLIMLHMKLFALWQRSQALLRETAEATGVAAPSLNPFNSTIHIDFEAEMVV